MINGTINNAKIVSNTKKTRSTSIVGITILHAPFAETIVFRMPPVAEVAMLLYRYSHNLLLVDSEQS
jgi:hypothetical protein